MSRNSLNPAPCALVVFLATLAACGQTGAVAPDATSHSHDAAFTKLEALSGSPEVQQWLAGLRRTIAPYHRYEAAVEAGYSAQITPCMEQAGAGGMGFHYGDTNLIDSTVEEFAPELLLFEPQKNGKLRLVAVEYIVPFTAWTEPEPPTLHGLSFHANDTFQVWALHAWVEQNNPAGIFQDWNPRISCKHAS